MCSCLLKFFNKFLMIIEIKIIYWRCMQMLYDDKKQLIKKNNLINIFIDQGNWY